MSYSSGRILLSSQREGQVSRFRAWVIIIVPLFSVGFVAFYETACHSALLRSRTCERCSWSPMPPTSISRRPVPIAQWIELLRPKEQICVRIAVGVPTDHSSFMAFSRLRAIKAKSARSPS